MGRREVEGRDGKRLPLSPWGWTTFLKSCQVSKGLPFRMTAWGVATVQGDRGWTVRTSRENVPSRTVALCHSFGRQRPQEFEQSSL